VSRSVQALLRGTPAARINRQALAATLPGVPAGPAAPWHRCHHEAPGGYLVWIPGLTLTSELNARETWAQRHRRSSVQHRAVANALERVPRLTPPCRVVITRCAQRALDTDNATGAAKYVRDAVALWLNIDDADPRVEWIVRQEPPAQGVGVRLEIVPRRILPRARVELGAVTRVHLHLTPDERASLARTLADPEADEVRLEVGDLILTIAGGTSP